MLLFGGEFYDTKTDRMRVFNDLFIYTIEEDTWTQLNIPHGYGLLTCHAILKFLLACIAWVRELACSCSRQP